MPGTGSVNCTFLGKAKIKPALTLAGGASSVTTKIKGALSSCTGTGDGGSISAAKIKGLIAGTTNACASLGTSGLPAFDASVKWKGSEKLNSSLAHFAATPPSGINLAGPNGSIEITLTGTFDTNDAKGNPGGSFGSQAFTAVVDTDQTLTDFTNSCGGKGLKSFTFTAVNAPSTFHTP
jgi:hypothetical protein